MVENVNDLNSVETYDVAADTWTLMPNMIEIRCQHSSVVVRNKLFVIGGKYIYPSCEVFEGISNKFVLLSAIDLIGYNNAWSIGTKIYILQDDKSFIVSYDIDKEKWSVEACEAIRYIRNYSCLKLPVY